MKDLKILVYCAVLCMITGCIVYRAIARQQKKIAVVDAIKLVDAFAMKNELEHVEQAKLISVSRQLDSIGNALKITQQINHSGEDQKNILYQYNYLKTRLDEEYAQSNRDINTQVWKRLNPLLEEYGKKEGLHLIIGANGMGNVLYTDEYYDITDKVTQYVNKRYAQGN